MKISTGFSGIVLVFTLHVILFGNSNGWVIMRRRLFGSRFRTTRPPIKTPPPTTTPACTPTYGYDEATNWCYGTICDKNGKAIAWDNFNCKPTTTPTTTTTTPPPTTMKLGCKYNGKFYPPGSEIERGEDKASNWCYGTFCDKSGQILAWDDFNCRKTTTLPTTTPRRLGCIFRGKFYPPGTEIERVEDKASNWCYGTSCDKSGQILAWDNFNCKPSTTPPTTTPKRLGCKYKGRFYPPGREMDRGEDKASNWCWYVYCDENGDTLYGDNFDCFTTTSSTSTTPTTPPQTGVPTSTFTAQQQQQQQQ